MISDQINQYNQTESEESQPIAEHFHDLIRNCDTTLTPMLTDLATTMLEVFPKECQKKAVESGQFKEWHLLEETINAIGQLNNQIINRYSSNLSSAFNQFIRGEAIFSEYSENELDVDSQLQSLSLIDNDEMEISVLITTITTGSSHHYADELYALGRRLAMINHGSLVDDQDKAFLLGPAQLCYAFLDAIQIAQIELYGEQSLIHAFHQHVINKLDEIYAKFNAMLIEAGILPNITYSSQANGSSGGQADLHNQAANEELEEQAADIQDLGIPQDQAQPALRQEVQQDIVQGIMSLLSERREMQVNAGLAAAPQQISPQQVQQRRDHLVTTIGSMQQSLNPMVLGDTANLSLDAARQHISQQTAQISKEVAETEPDSADADLIDMVGLLFEYILNDDNLPDNIKALLCHLHTPYLKVALLDRQFFMEPDHPARNLLDVLSKAGVYCDSSNKNALNIITKIRETVKRVIEEFDKEAELFEELVEQFNEAMEAINRRHAVVEKRAIDAAKGQDKIKLAREVVSRSVIDRLIKHPQIPKVMESMLMSSWGNYLMITLLRNGESSEEWKKALKLTDQLIWSVEPKQSIEDRIKLKKRLPRIVAKTRAAIELSGSSEEDLENLVNKLQKCHELVLLGYYTQVNETESGNNEGEAKRFNSLTRIMPDEWKESFKQKKASKSINEDIKKMFTVGVRLELIDEDKEKPTRGRISWVNEDNTQCLIVNEAGKQIAIQSVMELYQANQDGKLNILKGFDQPIFDRALSWIQSRIRQENNGFKPGMVMSESQAG
ncbi:MAG: DUF1631 domain-containing protein [Gammaproteobacteria bacterium]|nr:DUF1631 domain-containing protein [Gammaproteobacteria bacterium]